MKTSRNSFESLSTRGSVLLPKGGEQLLPLPAVVHKIGASRASIYAWVRDGRFPKPRKLGPRRVAWLASDLDAWIASRQAA